MAHVKITLDMRREKADGTYNIIYRITHFKRVYTINSGFSIPSVAWRKNKSCVANSHPNSKLINLRLLKRFYAIEEALLLLGKDFTIERLKIRLDGGVGSSYSFKNFAHKCISELFEANKTGNAIIYRTATNRFMAYCERDVLLDEIDYTLLSGFKHYLEVKGLKPNSISNYFRTLRAIYKKAIKHKLVSRDNYPFHELRVPVETTPKRALTEIEFKRLISFVATSDKRLLNALIYFLISYCLRGISFTDMAYLKTSAIVNGRITYKRRKTHKMLSVKLFDSTTKLISMLNNNNQSSYYLLPVMKDGMKEDSIEAKRVIKQWIKTTNKYLNVLANKIGVNKITTYTARHTFATQAKRMGFSNELIAESLGHTFGNTVTNIYLDGFDTDTLDKMHSLLMQCIDHTVSNV